MPACEPKDKANCATAHRRGVYPGSFNPPTVGHLCIIEAALAQHELDSLDLLISRRTINKESVDRPLLADRVDVLTASVAHLERVGVVVSDLQLIADIAAGYDVVVMGADKWHQVNDSRFYDDGAARDAAIARLPALAIAPRGDHPVPSQALLHVGEPIGQISSSTARAGARGQMTAAARDFDDRTGAWTNPDR